MILTIGHLPEEVNEQDVMSLLGGFAPVDEIRFLGDAEHRECQVSLQEESRTGMGVIVQRLNGHFWKDRLISANYFLFQ